MVAGKSYEPLWYAVVMSTGRVQSKMIEPAFPIPKYFLPLASLIITNPISQVPNLTVWDLLLIFNTLYRKEDHQKVMWYQSSTYIIGIITSIILFLITIQLLEKPPHWDPIQLLFC